MSLAGGKLAGASRKRHDGYAGAEIRQHDERRAEQLLDAGFRVLGVDEATLRVEPCNDWRKGLLAELLQAETIVKLDWIRQRLDMGDRSYCCRLIRRTRKRLPEEKTWQRARERVLKMSINHD